MMALNRVLSGIWYRRQNESGAPVNQSLAASGDLGSSALETLRNEQYHSKSATGARASPYSVVPG
uniref:Uncharacterized protein n=1 Tax=Spironucleus salmonicida TaxID=348837 RepID=V6LEW2_9EUKA|eukprot:EST43070.1 Hypothetical protein SS50377_17227 [Spironucleus salmonicida]